MEEKNKDYDALNSMLNSCEAAWCIWQEAAWMTDSSGQDIWVPNTKTAKIFETKMFEIRAKTIAYAIENNITERLPYYMLPV